MIVKSVHSKLKRNILEDAAKKPYRLAFLFLNLPWMCIASACMSLYCNLSSRCELERHLSQCYCLASLTPSNIEKEVCHWYFYVNLNFTIELAFSFDIFTSAPISTPYSSSTVAPSLFANKILQLLFKTKCKIGKKIFVGQQSEVPFQGPLFTSS